MTLRYLFIVRDLPRSTISTSLAVAGEEPLSGTHTAGLLVAEGLARRGHQVGVHVIRGQKLTASSFQTFADLDEAIEWVGNGRAVWISYGDYATLETLRAHGLRPVVWTHIHVSAEDRWALEMGYIEGIVTVSDTVRLPMLRSRRHECVGRIYNPLAPVFAHLRAAPVDRFERCVVAYAGTAGPTKGLHRLLEIWRFMPRLNPRARLILAGTGKLYGDQRTLGRFGISSPEFEAQYVEPLAQEFGSLTAAGIEIAGMLTPVELQSLYLEASLGVVNMNWSEYTETFCCAAVEMLATGLPVFSVARSALPETIGVSGGACLILSPEPRQAAVLLSALLLDPERLRCLGKMGQSFACTEYDWQRILDQWERMLRGDSSIEALTGRWRGPRSPRYFLEFLAGRAGAPWLIDAASKGFQVMRRFGSLRRP